MKKTYFITKRIGIIETAVGEIKVNPLTKIEKVHFKDHHNLTPNYYTDDFELAKKRSQNKIKQAIYRHKQNLKKLEKMQVQVHVHGRAGQ
jgi:hypothetical protein